MRQRFIYCLLFSHITRIISVFVTVTGIIGYQHIVNKLGMFSPLVHFMQPKDTHQLSLLLADM